MANKPVAKTLWSVLRSTGSTWATVSSLEEALAKQGIKYESWKSDSQFVFYEDFVTFRTVSADEDEIALSSLRLLHCGPPCAVSDEEIESLIDRFEKEENKGRKLHFHQRDAVRMVVKYNFSVLTGGPGTGKTTVLSCITYVLRKIREESRIIFTAPTGKAARRIKESTGEYASTTCKEFGITPEMSGAYEFEGDVLFIDESSMNDNTTLSLILEACPTGKKVCLVGDVNQLPSVGIGACLRDLIASAVIPVTKLTKTFRQDNSSKLFANIENIKNGSEEIVEGDDYHVYMIPEVTDVEAEQLATDKIKELYTEKVKQYGAENVVILVPYRLKKLCSNSINNVVQPLVNKKRQAYRYTNAENHTQFFMVDDFVMQLENRDECANGDVGQIISVSEKGVDVKYIDCTVHYELSELEQLALAYAMTIHKSQGSEYPCVIMCMLNEHVTMLSRNLLFTGVTRAKKECCLIYQKTAYKKAVSTIAEANRLTMLKIKLQKVAARYRMVYGAA